MCEGFHTGELSLDQAEAIGREWAALAERVLEPNPFLEPGFALTAARHFAPEERPRFIVARDPAGRLAGLFPMAAPGGLPGKGLARLWLSRLSPLATPLVDPGRPAETLAAFLGWIEETRPAAGVVFPRLIAEGPVHIALREAAAGAGRRIETLDSHLRAALLPGGASAEQKCAQAGGRKKLNEIQRLQRRIAEMGRTAVETSIEPEAIRCAVEEFLALEASGWKAGRGAFLTDPALATFLRAATRLLAGDGKCRIAALRLDGRAAAMAILIESQGRSCCWKIAYDERFRSQAPGVQLVFDLTARQLARPEVELTDSCAIANHPMIDRLWPDRLPICDLAVSLRAGDFGAALWREAVKRRAWAFARRAAHSLLKRKAR